MSSKLNMFAIALAGSAILASTGCGSKSSGTPAPAPIDPTVDSSAYQGDPGKFSSLYTGNCVVTSPNRNYTSCTTRVRIQQTAYLLFVRTQFFVNQSNTGNSEKIVGRSEDTFTIAGKDLLQNQQPNGVIGKDGFYFTRSGQPYHFVRLYPNNYEYVGTFVDEAGRAVTVTGRVQRGSPTQSSGHKSK